ncbi:MAG: hypothetical protein JWO45_762 [Spartobacteria bacterium]|nr:hypothetical protein [Spartobacteria bacterium]
MHQMKGTRPIKGAHDHGKFPAVVQGAAVSDRRTLIPAVWKPPLLGPEGMSDPQVHRDFISTRWRAAGKRLKAFPKGHRGCGAPTLLPHRHSDH